MVFSRRVWSLAAVMVALMFGGWRCCFLRFPLPLALVARFQFPARVITIFTFTLCEFTNMNIVPI